MAEDGLIYDGRVSAIFGRPGGGKTWIAADLIAQTIKAGQYVAWIDYEDTSRGAAGRLLDLGCTLDEIDRVTYYAPATSFEWGLIALQEDVIAAGREVALVVLDSVGEALAASAVKGGEDDGVAAFMRWVRAWAAAPSSPAVLVIDHVPKAEDAPKGYAIGSQRKLAAITGAAYLIETLQEPARGVDGTLKMTVAKDRLGARPKDSTAALVHVRTNASGAVRLTFVAPRTDVTADATEAGGAGAEVVFRPTGLMERVSTWLESVPRGASQRGVRGAVTGKDQALIKAIEVLRDEGYITVDGTGKYHSARPYRESTDPRMASMIADRPGWFPVVPGGSQVVPGNHLIPASEGGSPGSRSVPPVGGDRAPGNHPSTLGGTTSSLFSADDGEPPRGGADDPSALW